MEGRKKADGIWKVAGEFGFFCLANAMHLKTEECSKNTPIILTGSDTVVLQQCTLEGNT